MRRFSALCILLAMTCACGRQPLAPITPGPAGDQTPAEQTTTPHTNLPAQAGAVAEAPSQTIEPAAVQPHAPHTATASAAGAPATSASVPAAAPEVPWISAADRARVWRVGSRLRTAGAPLCKNTEHVFGFLVVDRPHFDTAWIDSQDASQNKSQGTSRNIRDDRSVHLRIWEVREDLMPAANLLARGDGILTVDGERMASLDDFNDAMASARRKGIATLTIVRLDGSVSEVVLQGEPACDQEIRLVHGDSITTYPIGGDVYLTTALLGTLESDDELAVMIAHDMAHETLGHLTRKRVQMGVGMLAEVAIMAFTAIPPTGALARFGKHAFANGMERDADRHGMYIAARAGYDPAPSAGLWTRYADRFLRSHSEEDPPAQRQRINTSTLLMNHPVSEDRFDAMESVSGYIEQQRAAGLALVPDAKRSEYRRDDDTQEPELEPGVVHVVPLETALPEAEDGEDLLRAAGRPTMAEASRP